MLSDLLKVKANVINECSRLVRDNIFKSKNHDGATIQKYNDERGFIIEPLATVGSYSPRDAKSPK